MTATTPMLAPPTPAAKPPPRTGTHVWRTGAVASLCASLATFAFAAAARAVDVPLTVGGEAIPLIGFAQLTLIASLVGTVLAAVLSNRANRPRHTFVVTTLVLTFVSFVPDVLADASTATKVALVLSHVVAAAIVIPGLASRLSD